jgi:hypothetical protein
VDAPGSLLGTFCAADEVTLANQQRAITALDVDQEQAIVVAVEHRSFEQRRALVLHDREFWFCGRLRGVRIAAPRGFCSESFTGSAIFFS